MEIKQYDISMHTTKLLHPNEKSIANVCIAVLRLVVTCRPSTLVRTKLYMQLSASICVFRCRYVLWIKICVEDDIYTVFQAGETGVWLMMG